MKRITLLVVVLALGLTANAQKKGLQGTWFATSQIGYQQTSVGNTKNSNVTILPIVGNFVAPTVAIGAGIGYVNVKSVTGSTTNANTGLLVFEPLVRKYYGITGGLYFFGQLAAPIITGKEKESSLKVSQFGLAASGGFDMVLGKHFTVEFSYNLANFSVTTLTPKTGSKTTVTDFSLAHVATVDPYFNTALAGSAPTLTTPLSFGFKFLF
jgi:hypothetical protein